uniref:Uncharacterized protein n=1 Tax=Meloidogyne javanica TaxID=6303 RepID=A0A915N502_MELJA
MRLNIKCPCNALPQAGHSKHGQHPALQHQQVRNLNTPRELYPALQRQQETNVNAQRDQHPALQQQQGRVENAHQYIQNLGSTQGQDNSGIGSQPINQQSVLNTTAHHYGDYLTQLRGQNAQYSQQTHNHNLNHQNVQHAPNVSINHLSNHQPANQQSNLDNYIRSLGDIILKSDPYFMNLWCKSVQYNDLYNEWLTEDSGSLPDSEHIRQSSITPSSSNIGSNNPEDANREEHTFDYFKFHK